MNLCVYIYIYTYVYTYVYIYIYIYIHITLELYTNTCSQLVYPYTFLHANTLSACISPIYKYAYVKRSPFLAPAPSSRLIEAHGVRDRSVRSGSAPRKPHTYVCMYIYIYIYIYVYAYVYNSLSLSLYIYIYIHTDY